MDVPSIFAYLHIQLTLYIIHKEWTKYEDDNQLLSNQNTTFERVLTQSTCYMRQVSKYNLVLKCRNNTGCNKMMIII